MKTRLLLLSLLTLCLTVSNSFAQNRWGIMSGVNLSTSSAKDFGWRAGGYIGGLYDIRLSDSWYIQPQLLYSYEENQTKGKSQADIFYSQHALTLPVLVSFKVPLSTAFALRVNAGPYVQYALFGRDKSAYSDANGMKAGYSLGWWHADFIDHFTYGLKGGVTLEHKHWFFSMDCKYSLKKSFLNNEGHGLTLSAGIGYKF